MPITSLVNVNYSSRLSPHTGTHTNTALCPGGAYEGRLISSPGQQVARIAWMRLHDGAELVVRNFVGRCRPRQHWES